MVVLGANPQNSTARATRASATAMPTRAGEVLASPSAAKAETTSVLTSSDQFRYGPRGIRDLRRPAARGGDLVGLRSVIKGA